MKRTSATTSVISLWTCVNTVDFVIDAVHYMKPFTLCETRVFPFQVRPESHTGGANARHCIRNLLWEVWSLWENAKHGQIRWTSDQMDLLSASSMHLLQIANLNNITQNKYMVLHIWKIEWMSQDQGETCFGHSIIHFSINNCRFQQSNLIIFSKHRDCRHSDNAEEKLAITDDWNYSQITTAISRWIIGKHAYRTRLDYLTAIQTRCEQLASNPHVSGTPQTHPYTTLCTSAQVLSERKSAPYIAGCTQ